MAEHYNASFQQFGCLACMTCSHWVRDNSKLVSCEQQIPTQFLVLEWGREKMGKDCLLNTTNEIFWEFAMPFQFCSKIEMTNILGLSPPSPLSLSPPYPPPGFLVISTLLLIIKRTPFRIFFVSPNVYGRHLKNTGPGTRVHEQFQFSVPPPHVKTSFLCNNLKFSHVVATALPTFWKANISSRKR